MKNKPVIVSFVISFIIAGSLLALYLVLNQQEKVLAPEPPVEIIPTKVVPPAPPIVIEEPATETPSTIKIRSAQDLMNSLVEVMKNKDIKLLENLLSEGYVTEQQVAQIQQTIEKINSEKLAAESIGFNSLGSSPVSRYQLIFDNGSTGIVDLIQNENSQWVVNELNLPQDSNSDTPVEVKDAMGIAHSFIQALTKADFKNAKKYVDANKVQDATIAGLCILFEEGVFKLRGNNPLKAAFQNNKNAGFFVYLIDHDGKNSGNIGLSLMKQNDNNWVITEASLDSMLERYAQNHGAGDDFFIPIVKNPKGGDSLALYFGFNEDVLSKRSERQLKIVAEAIKQDSGKKLEISGHTDDVGSEKYNLSLSERRALAVKNQLVECGVPAEQIVTKGFGKTQPRRLWKQNSQNGDIEKIRKENRRAEMYLDF